MLADHWGMPHSMSGVFGFGMGLVAMKVMDLIVTIGINVSKDPTILLSYAKLLKSLQNNGNSTTSNSDNSSTKSDLDSSGKVD
jgi:hypothetical protein